jgi:hypothetical protein
VQTYLERKVSHQNFDLLKPHLYVKMEVIRQRLIQIDKEYLCYQAEFLHINNKIPHTTFIGISKKELAYQTSFQTAIKKDNYGEIPVINKYEGEKKLSTLLPIKEEYMKPLQDPKLEGCIKQIHGALMNGYDDKYISIKFEQQIKETEALSVE